MTQKQIEKEYHSLMKKMNQAMEELNEFQLSVKKKCTHSICTSFVEHSGAKWKRCHICRTRIDEISRIG